MEVPRQGSFEFPAPVGYRPTTAQLLRFPSSRASDPVQCFRDSVLRTLVRLRIIPK
jgi:hypothetical protein